MSGVQRADLGDREKLLLMAAYLHGARPGAEIRANCWRVLRQAMRWAGVLTQQIESDTRRDVDNPIIDDWYRALIAMTQVPEPEKLIEGQGNLGSATSPPAFPSYTGCGLTDNGWKLAQRLFAEHPQYQALRE